MAVYRTVSIAILASLLAISQAAPSQRKLDLEPVPKIPVSSSDDPSNCFPAPPFACLSRGDKPECPEHFTPWNSEAEFRGVCWKCCPPQPNIKTIDIKITTSEIKSESPSELGLSYSNTLDTSSWKEENPIETTNSCLKACFREQVQCSDGWYAAHLEGCWTCCRNNGAASAPRINTMLESQVELGPINSNTPDMSLWEDENPIETKNCWKTCFQEKIQCPGKLIPLKEGPCWTCCQPEGSALSITIAINTLDESSPNSQPKDLSPLQVSHDDVYTRSKYRVFEKLNIEPSTQEEDNELEFLHSLMTLGKELVVIKEEVCWYPCQLQQPDCAPGWHKKKVDDGTCWACCTIQKDSSSFAAWDSSRPARGQKFLAHNAL